MPYTLCKNPVQVDTLAAVRYLHSQGFDARPAVVYERHHPSWGTPLPSARDHDTGETYCGFDAVIGYLERCFGITDLAKKAASFDHVNYSINHQHSGSVSSQV